MNISVLWYHKTVFSEHSDQYISIFSDKTKFGVPITHQSQIVAFRNKTNGASVSYKKPSHSLLHNSTRSNGGRWIISLTSFSLLFRFIGADLCVVFVSMCAVRDCLCVCVVSANSNFLTKYPTTPQEHRQADRFSCAKKKIHWHVCQISFKNDKLIFRLYTICPFWKN